MQQQNILLWLIIAFLAWYAFIRQKSDFCGACGGHIGGTVA